MADAELGVQKVIGTTHAFNFGPRAWTSGKTQVKYKPQKHNTSYKTIDAVCMAGDMVPPALLKKYTSSEMVNRQVSWARESILPASFQSIRLL